MTFVGIDPTRAAQLAATLRSSASHVDSAQHLLSLAMDQSDLAVPVLLPLDEVANDYRRVAHALDRARTEIVGFQIPTARPMPGSNLSALKGSTSWNDARQDASHNSFTTGGGVTALYAVGVRSFELDIHRGPPTDFTPDPGPLGRTNPWIGIAVDHFTHAGGRDDDWSVYHTSFDPQSEYLHLRAGLHAIAALPRREPITVFVDVKDRFAGTHTADLLDALLRSELGERLYTPADLMDRAQAASSLYEAIQQVGWPTVAELEGKVLVVLTDEVDDYEPSLPAAFVARPPTFDRSGGETIHVPEPNVIFYNAPSAAIGEAEVKALDTNDVVVRTYFNPECADDPRVNYRAVDVDLDDTSCLNLSRDG